jgi:hypothetical protein
MKRFQAILLAVLLLAGFMTFAEAGVIITSTDTSFDAPGDSGTSTAYIGDKGMRAETRAQGENSTIIFRSDKEVLWIINTAEKSYMEMTKQDIKKMKAQVDDAMRMMQEQMKNMPPEQRAMMEQMMKGQAMPAKPEKTVFKKISSGAKVNKWKCDTYKGYQGGKVTQEVCSTSWKKLGLDQKNFRVMERMGKFMSTLSPDAASQFSVGSDEWEKDQGFPGVSVRTTSYAMGRKVFQTEIKDIKKQRIDPSLFELPKGLRKKSMTGPMEQRR